MFLDLDINRKKFRSMVRGGRVPECLVEISCLRGKKDLTTVKPLKEHKDEVSC